MRGNDGRRSYEKFTPSNAADFDANYQPVNSDYPGATPTTYAVRDGDTLHSIARALWGDAGLWYLLAEANGLIGTQPNAALTTNATLMVPNRVTNIHNTSATFKPYHPGKALGDTSPTLPSPPAPPPPPPARSRRSGFARIIAMVIVVVAAVYTAGAVLQLLGPMMGTLLGTIAAGALAGAAASIVGQGVGMALGVQDRFSWKAVGQSALMGGITAGVTHTIGGTATPGTSASGATSSFTSTAATATTTPTWLTTAGRAAITNIASQGIMMVLGQQRSFDWRSVAASAAGSAAGSQAKSARYGTFGQGIARGLAGYAATGGNFQQALPAIVGSAIGDQLVHDYHRPTPSKSERKLSGAQQQNNDLNFQRDMANRRIRNPLLQTMAERRQTMPFDVATNPPRNSRQDIEHRIQLEIAGQEAREASLRGWDVVQTAGGTRGAARNSDNFHMVRNGNWDNALNMAADPFGLMGEMPGLKADLAQISQLQAKDRIDGMRQQMLNAGVKNVPGYASYISSTGSGIDFQATADHLGRTYENHVRDQRLRQTWGDNYESIRIGKSQMSPMEFEKRVLDIHQNATDRAYAKGVDMIQNGELKIPDGQYPRTLGIFVDEQVRYRLRDFARIEGINDSSASNIWAINRRLSNELVQSYGVPDGRIGNNIYHDTTLAMKDGYTEQIKKWNAIREGNFLIIRPTQLQGSYVIPRETIQPYTPQIKMSGRRM